jgi:hypothetical protein
LGLEAGVLLAAAGAFLGQGKSIRKEWFQVGINLLYLLLQV